MSWQALDTTNTAHSNQYKPVDHGKSEYSTDDDNYQTESDSEYDEIEIAAWGDNAPKEQPSWNSLIDPTIKIKADGIGSGGLHRKGVNFKPVSEQFIVAQRLNKGVPSKKSKKPKKKSTSTASLQAKPVAALLPAKPNRSYVPVIRSSAPARAPIKNPSASIWGSAPLAVTPFWEKKQEPSKPAAPPPPQVNALQNTGINTRLTAQTPLTNGVSWGAPQSNKDNLTALTPTVPATNTTPSLTSQTLPAYSIPPVEDTIKENESKSTATTTKWNIEAQGFDPSKGFNPVLKPEALKWNMKVPSFVPSTTASTSTSSAQSSVSSPLVYNANAPVFVPTFVPPPPIKKILKITSPTPAKEAPVLPAQLARETKSRVHLDQSLLRKHLDIKPFIPAGQLHSHVTEQPTNSEATTTTFKEQQPFQQSQFQSKSSVHGQLESQTQPESTRGFEQQPDSFLRINLEISEGISTTIVVQEGANPDDLAEEFGVTHRLKMTSVAKKNMAAFISSLIEKKKNEKKFGLID